MVSLLFLTTTSTSVLESFSLSLLLTIQLIHQTLLHPVNCFLHLLWILQAETGVQLAIICIAMTTDTMSFGEYLGGAFIPEIEGVREPTPEELLFLLWPSLILHRMTLLQNWGKTSVTFW